MFLVDYDDMRIIPGMGARVGLVGGEGTVAALA